MKARREKAAALLLAIVATAAPAACGGGSGAGTDAAPGGDAAVDAVVMSCDPYTQDCAPGSKCDFGCQGGAVVVACLADNGSGAPGTACTDGMPCARGAGCLSMSTTGAICRKYCVGDGDCLTGERCHNVDVGVRCAGPVATLPLHFCY